MVLEKLYTLDVNEIYILVDILCCTKQKRTVYDRSFQSSISIRIYSDGVNSAVMEICDDLCSDLWSTK